jgi:hypothetical protein
VSQWDPRACPSGTPTGIPVYGTNGTLGTDGTADIGWNDAHAERAAIVEYDGGAPREWAEGFTLLDRARPPDHVPQRRWLRFIDDCGAFLDGSWPAKAVALGWGAPDLFGCDRHKPFVRVDRLGLLWLLNGRTIVAITADSATIATSNSGRLNYRRAPDCPGRVVAWSLCDGGPPMIRRRIEPELSAVGRRVKGGE